MDYKIWIVSFAVLCNFLNAAERSYYSSLKYALSRKNSPRKTPTNSFHNTQILAQSDRQIIKPKHKILHVWKQKLNEFISKFKCLFQKIYPNQSLNVTNHLEFSTINGQRSSVQTSETAVNKILGELQSDMLVERSQAVGMELNEELVHRYYVASQWTGKYHSKRLS